MYAQANELKAENVRVVSTDEKTGIQALERKYPDKAMKANYVRYREHEYIRHGTQSLIANFDIATGQCFAPSIADTRTEHDFVEHIEQTIASDNNPETGWIFIVDQLNIHKSESLVRFVAKHCKITTDLGIKGKAGILKSMKSRANFLSNAAHDIRFVYTPKHSSWLNQIEIWFSILVRRLLKTGNFSSTQDLRKQILDFIDYFNKTMAKPFKWTYAGRPLQA